MRKKHLKALKTIENALKKHLGMPSELSEAFKFITSQIELLPDEEKSSLPSELPAPKEIENEPMAIALYSDGGCRGNPGPGAWAYVVQDHSGKILSQNAEFHELTTNNKMELSGPLEGLTQLIEVLKNENLDARLTKIKVLTDSKYVVDGMKSWVPGWKMRGWKKADGKAPENLDLWQSLDKIKDEFFEIEWQWVKGHAGHPQNEYCDQLANTLMDEHMK